MADPKRTSAGVSIELEPFSAPESQALDRARQAEIVERYGWDSEPGVKPAEHDLAAFLVARDPGGRAVGCGGLRPLGDGAVEIKRMYVSPAARGAGLGRRLLSALESEARRLGFSVCRLETGDLQTEAIALYESAGYRPVECWGAYADSEISRCYALDMER
jgi:putative acetyltransferase